MILISRTSFPTNLRHFGYHRDVYISVNACTCYRVSPCSNVTVLQDNKTDVLHLPCTWCCSGNINCQPLLLLNIFRIASIIFSHTKEETIAAVRLKQALLCAKGNTGSLNGSYLPCCLLLSCYLHNTNPKGSASPCKIYMPFWLASWHLCSLHRCANGEKRQVEMKAVRCVARFDSWWFFNMYYTFEGTGIIRF